LSSPLGRSGNNEPAFYPNIDRNGTDRSPYVDKWGGDNDKTIDVINSLRSLGEFRYWNLTGVWLPRYEEAHFPT